MIKHFNKRRDSRRYYSQPVRSSLVERIQQNFLRKYHFRRPPFHPLLRPLSQTNFRPFTPFCMVKLVMRNVRLLLWGILEHIYHLFGDHFWVFNQVFVKNTTTCEGILMPKCLLPFLLYLLASRNFASISIVECRSPKPCNGYICRPELGLKANQHLRKGSLSELSMNTMNYQLKQYIMTLSKVQSAKCAKKPSLQCMI